MREPDYDKIDAELLRGLAFERAAWLDAEMPHCPECGSEQVQVKAPDASRWRCRMCKHHFVVAQK